MHINVVLRDENTLLINASKLACDITIKKRTSSLIPSYRVFNKQKKNAIPWSTTPQRSCPPRPPIQRCPLNFVSGALQKKNSHFCWWCSALPITTLKLGVAGVSKVCISVVSCGWLFFFLTMSYRYIEDSGGAPWSIYSTLQTQGLSISWVALCILCDQLLVKGLSAAWITGRDWRAAIGW